MKWNKEDIEMVEKFIDIRNRGYYCDGAQLTEVYNRVLEKHVNPTNCGSCLRQRVNELADALERFKKLSEASKPDEGTVVKEEENKELTEAEIMKERMAKVRAAKKNK
jgi:hypothetical protein